MAVQFNLNAQDPDFYGREKCGTFADEQTKKRVKENLILSDDGRPDSLPHKYPSPGGRFLVHYSTEGINAVPALDSDNNGIPDYVDSAAYFFDYTFQVEVTELGYLDPPKDNNKGGTDQYDIYLLQLGNEGLYGLTVPEDEVFPRRKFTRWTSYIILDNDYTPLDSFIYYQNGKVYQTYYTTGYNGLKISAAHEFHHSIQFAYGDPEPYTGALHEMSSVWMEYRLYPHLKDYYQYLNGLFRDPKRYPFGDGNGSNGYRWSVFVHFINKEYDETILRRMWELIYNGKDGYGSLDSAFGEQGSSLANAWCEFQPWMYFTGSRAQSNQYFADAANFPELRYYPDDKAHEFSLDAINLNGDLLPFEIRLNRVNFKNIGTKSDDTLDILSSNTDTYSARTQSLSDNHYEIGIFNSDMSGSSKIQGLDYWIISDFEKNHFCNTLLSYPGSETCDLEYVYPNPYKTSFEGDLFFPAPKGAELGSKKAHLAIYNSEMVGLFSGEFDVSVHNGCKVVVWKSPMKLSSGVYIYAVTYNEVTNMGKIAVQN